MRSALLGVGLAALSLLACASTGEATGATRGATKPAGVASTRQSRAEVQRPPLVSGWLASTQELGQALRAAGSDCGRVAAAVNAHTRSHGDQLGAMFEAVLVWERDVSRKTSQILYSEARRDINQRIDTAIRCDGTPAARRAFDAYLKASGLDTR